MLAWLSVVLVTTLLAGVVLTTFALVTIRIGLFPLRAMICLMRSQLDFARVKLHGVAPESYPTMQSRVWGVWPSAFAVTLYSPGFNSRQ